jgi:S-ribosylhomocysteine lyase
LSSKDVLPLLIELMDWIVGFQGDIPGAHPAECGNYLEQNLSMAKWEAKRYGDVLKNAKPENLNYPA